MQAGDEKKGEAISEELLRDESIATFSSRLAPGFTPRFIMGGMLGTSNGFPMIIERRS